MPEKLDASIVGEHEKFLFYGGPGTGKTFTALTLPPPIYVIVFGGANELKTARSRDFIGKHGEPEIYFDAVEEEQGAKGKFVNATAFDQAADLIDEALENERKGDFEFNSLVLDSATGLSNVAMNKSISVTAGMAKSKANTALNRLMQANILIPGDQDWAGEMSLVSQMVDWCFRLPKHFCLTAHEYIEEDTDRSSHTRTVVGRKPQFIGRNRDRIPAMFDNVWYMTAIADTRGIVAQARTIRDDITYAKTRMGGVLPMNLRDPDLTKIIKQFKESQ
jgi:hypothetical protein